MARFKCRHTGDWGYENGAQFMDAEYGRTCGMEMPGALWAVWAEQYAAQPDQSGWLHAYQLPLWWDVQWEQDQNTPHPAYLADVGHALPIHTSSNFWPPADAHWSTTTMLIPVDGNEVDREQLENALEKAHKKIQKLEKQLQWEAKKLDDANLMSKMTISILEEQVQDLHSAVEILEEECCKAEPPLAGLCDAEDQRAEASRELRQQQGKVADVQQRAAPVEAETEKSEEQRRQISEGSTALESEHDRKLAEDVCDERDVEKTSAEVAATGRADLTIKEKQLGELGKEVDPRTSCLLKALESERDRKFEASTEAGDLDVGNASPRSPKRVHAISEVPTISPTTASAGSEEPSCSSPGHDLWNHILEVPESWEAGESRQPEDGEARSDQKLADLAAACREVAEEAEVIQKEQLEAFDVVQNAERLLAALRISRDQHATSAEVAMPQSDGEGSEAADGEEVQQLAVPTVYCYTTRDAFEWWWRPCCPGFEVHGRRASPQPALRIRSGLDLAVYAERVF